GARGALSREIPWSGNGQEPATYTVRLYFTALEHDQPGQRVFDIKLQDKTVTRGFDLVAQAGGVKRAFMTEFHDIPVSDNLVLELVSSRPNPDASHQPILSGLEVVRSNAKEITDRVASR